MNGDVRSVASAKVVICVGAGGVGKTTVAAALGLGLAAEGRRVALVTIDPARRLAEALGLDELGNHPSLVDQRLLAGSGLRMRGQLWAMMLDVSLTFDELISRLAPDAAVRDEILANGIYRNLSTAIAGSQEYTAMAKLFELALQNAYDTIVLDTPPSRNALDFLQAPGRLSALLEGRTFALLARPGSGAARTASVLLGALSRVLGVSLLHDLASFFRLIGGMSDGFRDRADGVAALLADPETAFVLIASPEHAAIEEATFLGEALIAAGSRRHVLVINRLHRLAAKAQSEGDTVRRLAPTLGRALAGKVARTHAEVQALARHDARAIKQLRAAFGGARVAYVAEREDDVHDVKGLAAMLAQLFARAPDNARELD